MVENGCLEVPFTMIRSYHLLLIIMATFEVGLSIKGIAQVAQAFYFGPCAKPAWHDFGKHLICEVRGRFCRSQLFPIAPCLCGIKVEVADDDLIGGVLKNANAFQQLPFSQSFKVEGFEVYIGNRKRFHFRQDQ